MNLKYVIIDAGHGIDTPGKRTPLINNNKDYIIEFEFNISLSIMLYKLLKDSNIKVDFSFNSLYDSNLSDRIFNINKNLLLNKHSHKPILVSFHTNAFGDGKSFNNVRGIEILYNPDKSEGLKLSEFIHKEFISNIPNLIDRGLKNRSNLALLNKLDLPACIIECGFMTNKEDIELLTNYNYKLTLVHAIYKAIIKYYE